MYFNSHQRLSVAVELSRTYWSLARRVGVAADTLRPPEVYLKNMIQPTETAEGAQSRATPPPSKSLL